MRSDDGQRGFRVHVRLPGPLVSHRQAEKAPLLGSGFVVYIQQMDRWIDSLVKLLSTILSFQELIMDLFLLVGLASIISAVYVLLLLFSLTARSLFLKKIGLIPCADGVAPCAKMNGMRRGRRFAWVARVSPLHLFIFLHVDQLASC